MKTVLVIEDEEDYRMMLSVRLHANGYNVLEAGDGDAGLELVRVHRPDIIILDVLLPKMNGFVVAKLLKQNPLYRNIPLIMLTALTYEKSEETGLLSGADAYLTKSCDSSLLLNKISDILKNEQSK